MKRLVPLIALFLPLTVWGESTIKDGPEGRDLLYGARPIWRHMNTYDNSSPEKWAITYKTYHHVYGLDGKGFITKGPGGQYTHHRGIYLGWSKTKVDGKSYDFWHVKGNGSQGVKHKKYIKEELGKDKAHIVSVTEWETPEGKAVVRDTRDTTTRVWKNGTVQMDFVITVEAVDGDVYLGGDPQHAGFQFRPVNEVTKTKATFIRQASASGGKGDVWKTCNWIANTFKVGEQPYTVVHMNAPANPGGEKTVYSTRNYGRFGAFAEHELKKGSPLTFKYRLLIMDGKVSKELGVEDYERYFKEFTD